jgi:hypothetical protein
MGSKAHYSFHKSLPLGQILRQPNEIYVLTSYYFKFNFNVVLPYTPSFHKRFSPFGLLTEILYSTFKGHTWKKLNLRSREVSSNIYRPYDLQVTEQIQDFQIIQRLEEFLFLCRGSTCVLGPIRLGP